MSDFWQHPDVGEWLIPEHKEIYRRDYERHLKAIVQGQLIGAWQHNHPDWVILGGDECPYCDCESISAPNYSYHFWICIDCGAEMYIGHLGEPTA